MAPRKNVKPDFFEGGYRPDELENKVLEYWKTNKIFEKSVSRRQPSKKSARRSPLATKPFIFYEGPPTANGRPGLHHVLVRTFKDIILRYKTMAGFYVPRRGGWDTHGLPVEIQVEKELGLKSKKEIEQFGVARFNEKCKESVWKFKDEWERLTTRMGYWLDLDHVYITYKNEYIETLWAIIKKISERGLLYGGNKIVPWCPRCGTALSSHEVAQSYKEVVDNSVYLKFKLKPGQKIGTGKTGGNSYILSWTTTPWTLPGNVALAVGREIEYALSEKNGEELIYAKERGAALGFEKTGNLIPGKDLIGLEYEPLFVIPELQNDKSYKIYAADFVTTTDGTGVVHTAVMYGEDDYRLGTEIGLPTRHTVSENGRFNELVKELGALYVKSAEAEKKIFDYLESKNYLFKTESYKHEYMHCWRCDTPLLYFARKSWFVSISRLKNDLLKNNRRINWIPSHIKNGRFGEWLKEAKDWNFSRERFWGTPLPVWICQKCRKTHVIGSYEELQKKVIRDNSFIFVRHGEADHIVDKLTGPSQDTKKYTSRLTANGKKQIELLARSLKGEKIDAIICSPLARSRETAEIISKFLNVPAAARPDLADLNTGIFDGRPEIEFRSFFKNQNDYFHAAPPGGESRVDVQCRILNALKEIDKANKNKTILVVGHADPLLMLNAALNFTPEARIRNLAYPKLGAKYEIKYWRVPQNMKGEPDVHRPGIDEVKLWCECKGETVREKEVIDVWYDSGSMPFAANENPVNSSLSTRHSPLPYPADYICEGIDQTRGWFYTLLAVSTALGKSAPYKNVISLGLLHDKFGRKMSKSKGNVVDPWEMMQKYGIDATRWYMYTMNPEGEPKNFDEGELGKTLRRFLMILYNSLVFYKTYAAKPQKKSKSSSILNPQSSILDAWIIIRLHETQNIVTSKLNSYFVRDAALEIEKLVDDLSRWYIRRSRRRLQKPQSRKEFLAASRTLYAVLSEIAKLLAPFCPFFAEALNFALAGHESVHLSDWTNSGEKVRKAVEAKLMRNMQKVRGIASAALAARSKLGVKIRQPLSELKIKDLGLRKEAELLELLKDEVNVKKIIFDAKLNTDLELNTEISPELKIEGTVRELIRAVQELRAKANLKPVQTIELYLESSGFVLYAVQSSEQLIKKETNTKKIMYKKPARFDAVEETKIDGIPVYLALKKMK